MFLDNDWMGSLEFPYLEKVNVPSASKNEIIMSIGMPEDTSRLNPLWGTNLMVAKNRLLKNKKIANISTTSGRIRIWSEQLTKSQILSEGIQWLQISPIIVHGVRDGRIVFADPIAWQNIARNNRTMRGSVTEFVRDHRYCGNFRQNSRQGRMRWRICTDRYIITSIIAEYSAQNVFMKCLDNIIKYM